MADTPTLARFFTGWEHLGPGKDGMPRYAENIMIQLDRPPYLSVRRVATVRGSRDVRDVHGHCEEQRWTYLGNDGSG